MTTMIKDEHLITDEVEGYIQRLKNSNEKLGYWRSYLYDKCDGASHLRYCEVDLWDVFIGSWAAQDVFGKLIIDYKGSAKKGRTLKILRVIKDVLYSSKVLFVRRNAAKSNRNIFVAFERRQIDTFLETMVLLDEKAIDFNVLTTINPSHAFSREFHEDQKVIFIEQYLPFNSIVKIFRNLIRIHKWLRGVENNSKSLPEMKLNELRVVLEQIRTNLFTALKSIRCSENIVTELKPTALLASDNSDPRVRALFLVARKYGIKTYHVPYSFANEDSFEEKYVVADKKVIYSERHKQLLMDKFQVNEGKLQILGCPRFDKIFKMRSVLPLKDKKQSFTIVIGSQPSSSCGYGCLPHELKLQRLEALFKAISKSEVPANILIKPHPDEPVEEVQEIMESANRYSLDVRIVDSIRSIEILGNSDLFVTFYSTLALEFLIAGAPIAFLASVDSIPLLKRASEANLAIELINEEAIAEFIENLVRSKCDNLMKSAQYLASEFTRIDGKASEELAKILQA